MLRFNYRRVHLSQPAPTLAGAIVRSRPVISVGLRCLGNTAFVRLLVDSGADDTILPTLSAGQLGLDLTNAPVGEAVSASGTLVCYPCARVVMRISDGIEWCEWEAMVGFTPMPAQSGLAGRAGFLDFFKTELFGDLAQFTLDPNPTYPGQHGTH